jgi:SAM-dependent methyltransferase
MEDISEYLSGKKLYGDDFDIDEIKKWVEYQEKWYNDTDNELNYNDKSTYVYSYNALNNLLGYSKLPKDLKFRSILGFGSAYGEELKPVIPKSGNITILEISENFINTHIDGKPVKYVKPEIDGKLDFPDKNFDLVVCISVLHHIPNVSKIISEISRVLTDDGYALIREPINSMGDWRFPRKGLSGNERGIPLGIFRKAFKNNNLTIISERFWCFKLTSLLFQFISKFYKKPIYNLKWAAWMDYLCSSLFIWNINYHPKNWFKTLRPVGVFYVLKKQSVLR